MIALWLATCAVLCAAILVVALLLRRPRLIGGGFRAESWLDRQLCGVLHGGRHAYRFDPDGTRTRVCQVHGCSMMVVKRPLYLRIREQARKEATAELRKWGRG